MDDRYGLLSDITEIKSEQYNEYFPLLRENNYEVLGFSNRRSAWRANGDSTGAISSTNAMMLMANGENEISLEIGALGWFSDKPASMEERGRFFPKAGCRLDLVRWIKR